MTESRGAYINPKYAQKLEQSAVDVQEEPAGTPPTSPPSGRPTPLDAELDKPLASGGGNPENPGEPFDLSGIVNRVHSGTGTQGYNPNTDYRLER